jgi:uncharacterized protein (TIRG00374 family)
MSSSSYLKRNWKLILNVITIAAMVVLAIAVRKQLVQTIENLGKINGWALLLIVPIEFLNYHAQTRLYQRLFAMVDEELPYKKLFKVSLELNFVNHIFPSGGVTGISYFGLRLRNEGVKSAKSTVVQFMKLAMLFSSFEFLLLFGMLLLAAVGKVNNLIILIGGSLTTLLVVGTAGFVYIIGDRKRIQSFFSITTRILNRIIQIVRPKQPETISIERLRPFFDDMHDNYVTFQSKPAQLKAPFWYAMLANATEILAVYVVYLAFGHWINLGAVILAYAVANFAGLVSVLPGGIGVYEALMTAVLVAGGVPAAVSIPATIMYRVVNTLLQVPFGYYFYHRSLAGTGRLQHEHVD